jgi:FAS-associated factor 2
LLYLLGQLLIKHFLLRIARYFTRQSITGGNRSVPLSQQRQDPQAIAARFLREFEDQFGTTHVEFFPGGYSQALETAKSQLSFLMIVLQSDEHDDTPSFCQ